MSQARRASIAEAAVNVAIGYGVAVCAQSLIFPLFGLAASVGDHLGIAGCFTVVSLLRSYVLRRVFNRFSARKTP